MRIRILAAILLAAAAVAAPSPGEAYCLLGRDFTGFSSIPVWITPNLWPLMWHQDGTAWTQSEVENELRWTLQAIHETSGATVPRMWYAGVRSACSNGASCRISGAIVVMPDFDASATCKSWADGWGVPASAGSLCT